MSSSDDEYPDKIIGKYSIDKDWDTLKGEIKVTSDNQTDEESEAHQIWLKLVDDINEILGDEDIDILRISQYKDD